MFDWLVVSTPLKNIGQLGLFFPIYGKTIIKNTNQFSGFSENFIQPSFPAFQHSSRIKADWLSMCLSSPIFDTQKKKDVSEKEAWNSKPKERTCLGQVLGGSTLGHTEIIRKPTEQYRTIHMFVRGLLWECFCRIVRWRCHGPNGYYHSIRYSIYAI